jgi:inorganic pyrophosphatase
MNIAAISPIDKRLINVIIETPRGSGQKFHFNEALQIFELKKMIPAGMVFSFDFGFLPNTKGQDGDPLDVLVIMEAPSFPGCLIRCRLIGVLEANQKLKAGKTQRNDRIIGIADCSLVFARIKTIRELGGNMVQQIESFFINYINYDKESGKKFEPLGWKGAGHARELIRKQMIVIES